MNSITCAEPNRYNNSRGSSSFTEFVHWCSGDINYQNSDDPNDNTYMILHPNRDGFKCHMFYKSKYGHYYSFELEQVMLEGRHKFCVDVSCQRADSGYTTVVTSNTCVGLRRNDHIKGIDAYISWLNQNYDYNKFRSHLYTNCDRLLKTFIQYVDHDDTPECNRDVTQYAIEQSSMLTWLYGRHDE